MKVRFQAVLLLGGGRRRAVCPLTDDAVSDGTWGRTHESPVGGTDLSVEPLSESSGTVKWVASDEA